MSPIENLKILFSQEISHKYGFPEGLKLEVGEVLKEKMKKIKNAVEVLIRNGFQPISPPSLDFPETFSAIPSNPIKESIFYTMSKNSGLISLRFDITSQVIKYAIRELKTNKNINQLKLFYIANIFRDQKKPWENKEKLQLGAECIGRTIDVNTQAEMIHTSIETAKKFYDNKHKILVLNTQKPYLDILESYNLDEDTKEVLNVILMRKDKKSLSYFKNTYKELIEKLEKLSSFAKKRDKNTTKEIEQLFNQIGVKDTLFLEILEKIKESDIIVDLGFIKDWKYYNGLVYMVIGEGIEIEGGEYDMLIKKLVEDLFAFGFAIYI